MKLNLIIFLLVITGIIQAQNNPKWDNTVDKNWPKQFSKIEIPSSLDGEIQKAFIHFSKSKTPKPLIISLHTWSGDFTQKDPLTKKIMETDWNYIHPDFRGPNKTPKACGSKFVVSDIDDAISYALKNANVDSTNIHIIGVSGGGFATMLSYMKTKHTIRSFSAWVGISNLVKWYYESLGRGNNYARHIALATTGDTLNIDIDDAISRSTVFMKTPVEQRKNSKLFLYCGVHDGYSGSVPITQTIDFYNKVVDDFHPENTESKVPTEIVETMVRQQNLPGVKIEEKLGDRKIIYRNSFQDKVYLNVFEGGHEMIVETALNHVPSKSILTIGDSNGAAENGWANQLKKIRSADLIVNTSVSGNTIGFNNANLPRLNTLTMVDSYIQKGVANAKTIDCVVILLGTNDCKAIFADQLKEVPKNLERLISSIQNSTKFNETLRIIVVSPPPYGPDEILKEKYKGGAKRVSYLTTEFEKVARKTGVEFLDIHTPLKPIFNLLSHDGVHLSEEGQIIIAKLIDKKIDF
ncbi:MAG: GDSL-type esterase/lipase family protein [Draconibacterium sp.]|nr:GDSL-type esterase/lipase family protein [Draconibacterium sp.]